MRKISIFDVMNQRKPFSHLLFIGFSLLVAIIADIVGRKSGSYNFSKAAFILIFCQLEVFIFFGNIIFSNVNFDKNPGEVTRIIIVRFMIFMSACLFAAMILFLLLQYSIFILRGEDVSKVLYTFIYSGFHEWFRSTITGLSVGAIIFTTAYDEFTLKAFKVNSIDYLLKPIDEELLKSAVTKFKKLYAENDPFKKDFRLLLNEFKNQYKLRFLIKIGDKYRSVHVGDISHFHILERSVFLSDFQGKDNGVDYSLEQLQTLLDPHKYFRINRECIVNIDAISLMSSYSSSRLHLTIKNQEKSDLFVVSREKVSDFKKWIDK